ncbi:acyl-CoA N-acyltransferase [Mortierella sp. GBAus27b]|nr:hypothetical protein BGX31_004328 [Mortierella sp. GBA43]KAI8354372.1 acyl-CoA N-acyltransferase [Mortierella sp. GBAus27b]
MADDKLYIQSPTETARLTLDLASADDDDAMRAMLSDLETMVHLRYMAKEEQGGWTPEEIVARRETHWKAMTEKQASTFYIHEKATREFAGVMGVNRINFKDRNAVVGIILRKKYWSGGYGTEAQYELLRSLFDDLKMHKVLYETTESNTGMRGFLERTCGVSLAYTRKDEIWCEATNNWIDLIQYEIFEGDWPRIQSDLLKRMERGAAKHASG